MSLTFPIYSTELPTSNQITSALTCGGFAWAATVADLLAFVCEDNGTPDWLPGRQLPRSTYMWVWCMNRLPKPGAASSSLRQHPPPAAARPCCPTSRRAAHASREPNCWHSVDTAREAGYWGWGSAPVPLLPVFPWDSRLGSTRLGLEANQARGCPVQGIPGSPSSGRPQQEVSRQGRARCGCLVPAAPAVCLHAWRPLLRHAHHAVQHAVHAVTSSELPTFWRWPATKTFRKTAKGPLTRPGALEVLASPATCVHAWEFHEPSLPLPRCTTSAQMHTDFQAPSSCSKSCCCTGQGFSTRPLSPPALCLMQTLAPLTHSAFPAVCSMPTSRFESVLASRTDWQLQATCSAGTCS